VESPFLKVEKQKWSSGRVLGRAIIVLINIYRL